MFIHSHFHNIFHCKNIPQFIHLFYCFFEVFWNLLKLVYDSEYFQFCLVFHIYWKIINIMLSLGGMIYVTNRPGFLIYVIDYFVYFISYWKRPIEIPHSDCGFIYIPLFLLIFALYKLNSYPFYNCVFKKDWTFCGYISINACYLTFTFNLSMALY